MTSTCSQAAAAAAARRILGFYPTIPASDPKGFAAGLVQLLSTYPTAVIERAADPVSGIPSKVEFLNLAAIRKHLDVWYGDHADEVRRAERLSRKALPEPPRDEEVASRITKGLAELSRHIKSGFSPSTAPGPAGADHECAPANPSAVSTDQLRQHYAAHGLGFRPRSAEQ